MTRARISLILCFILTFLSFQMIVNLASSAIVWRAFWRAFSSRTLITDYDTEVFEVVYCFQLLPLYRDVSL